MIHLFIDSLKHLAQWINGPMTHFLNGVGGNRTHPGCLQGSLAGLGTCDPDNFVSSATNGFRTRDLLVDNQTLSL